MKGLKLKVARQYQEISNLKSENKDMHEETIKLRNDMERKVKEIRELNADVKENNLKVRHMRAEMEKMGKDMEL